MAFRQFFAACAMSVALTSPAYASVVSGNFTLVIDSVIVFDPLSALPSSVVTVGERLDIAVSLDDTGPSLPSIWSVSFFPTEGSFNLNSILPGTIRDAGGSTFLSIFNDQPPVSGGIQFVGDRIDIALNVSAGDISVQSGEFYVSSLTLNFVDESGAALSSLVPPSLIDPTIFESSTFSLGITEFDGLGLATIEGNILPGPAIVPLPAPALLFASGLGLLAYRRARITLAR